MMVLQAHLRAQEQRSKESYRSDSTTIAVKFPGATLGASSKVTTASAPDRGPTPSVVAAATAIE